MNIFNIVIWIWTKTRSPILHTILIIKAWFICHCGFNTRSKSEEKKQDNENRQKWQMANVMHALCPGELWEQKERVQGTKCQIHVTKITSKTT